VDNNLQVLKYTYDELLSKREELVSYHDPKEYITNYLGSYGSFLLKNPNIDSNEIALSIAVYNKKIIGRLGFIRGVYEINNKIFPIIWLQGFDLDNEHRQTGAGAMLLLNGLNTKLSFLASGGPSQECQDLYKAAGFLELGPLKRYLFFLKLNVPIIYLLRNKKISNILTSIIQPIYNFIVKFFLSILNEKNTIRFKSVKAFEDSIDEIESSTKDNLFPTYTSLLNWSLFAPGTKNYLFQLYLKDELIGYTILRVSSFEDESLGIKKLRMGSLHHYRLIKEASSINLKKELLVFSLNFLLKENIDIFECQSLDNQMVSACKKLFMLRKGGNKIYFRSKKHSKLVQSLDLELSKAISDVILY